MAVASQASLPCPLPVAEDFFEELHMGHMFVDVLLRGIPE
jgi:hypothetical protein